MCPFRPEKYGTERPLQALFALFVLGLVRAPDFGAGSRCSVQNQTESLRAFWEVGEGDLRIFFGALYGVGRTN
jgi:hypothetical protein